MTCPKQKTTVAVAFDCFWQPHTPFSMTSASGGLPPAKAGSFAREILPKTSRLKIFPRFFSLKSDSVWLEIHPPNGHIPPFERGNISSNLPFERLFRPCWFPGGKIYSNLFHIYTDTCLFTANIFIYTHICACTFLNAPILAVSWTSQHSTEVQWIEMLRRNAAMESDPMRSNFLQLCHGLRASWLLKVGF